MPLKSGTSQKYYYCITVLMLIFFLLFELNCGNFRISILVARFQLVAEDSCCLPLLLVTVQSLFKQVVQLLFILWSGAIGLRSMIPVSFSQFRYFSCGFYYELPSLRLMVRFSTFVDVRSRTLKKKKSLQLISNYFLNVLIFSIHD